jgi:hypothetical protein
MIAIANATVAVREIAPKSNLRDCRLLCMGVYLLTVRLTLKLTKGTGTLERLGEESSRGFPRGPGQEPV